MIRKVASLSAVAKAITGSHWLSSSPRLASQGGGSLGQNLLQLRFAAR